MSETETPPTPSVAETPVAPAEVSPDLVVVRGLKGWLIDYPKYVRRTLNGYVKSGPAGATADHINSEIAALRGDTDRLRADAQVHMHVAGEIVRSRTYNPNIGTYTENFDRVHRTTRPTYGDYKQYTALHLPNSTEPNGEAQRHHPRTLLQQTASRRQNNRARAIKRQVDVIEPKVGLYSEVMLFDKKKMESDLRSGSYTWGQKRAMRAASKLVRKADHKAGRIAERIERAARGEDLQGRVLHRRVASRERAMNRLERRRAYILRETPPAETPRPLRRSRPIIELLHPRRAEQHETYHRLHHEGEYQHREDARTSNSEEQQRENQDWEALRVWANMEDTIAARVDTEATDEIGKESRAATYRRIRDEERQKYFGADGGGNPLSETEQHALKDRFLLLDHDKYQRQHREHLEHKQAQRDAEKLAMRKEPEVYLGTWNILEGAIKSRLADPDSWLEGEDEKDALRRIIDEELALAMEGLSNAEQQKLAREFQRYGKETALERERARLPVELATQAMDLAHDLRRKKRSKD